MKRLFLIGGPMGVGKTAVGQYLKRALPRAVFLDGDWCWDADPFQVTEETKAMVLDNICFLLDQFLRCSAYEHIIFCWVMHEQKILDEILARVDTAGCQVEAVSLMADPATLEARIRGDAERGLRSMDVLERSLARLPLYERLDTIKVDTVGKTAAEIGEEIRGGSERRSVPRPQKRSESEGGDGTEE